MFDTFLVLSMVAIIITLIWWYESRQSQLEVMLVRTEDELGDEIIKNAELRKLVADQQRLLGKPFTADELARHSDEAIALTTDQVVQLFSDGSTCGATDGRGLVCSLPPHDTAWHEDRSKGNRWHSATFKTEPRFTPEQIDQYN